MTTLDVPTLPWQMDGGVKVFRLVAEVVRTEFVPGRAFDLWGYNGSCPGPTIEANEGDRVRFLFENRLPEPTTVHWHGIELPIAMDGVPGISQPLVRPGERFTYEFTLRQNGTFFYHTHMAMQEMMGALGFFIIHPREAYRPVVHKDFGIVLQEWAVLPGNTVPNTSSMEFNWLTFNGKAGPAVTPMLVKLGERVRIRFINIGMDHHPIHLHGVQFWVTGTESGRIPEALWYRQNTVLVGVGQARDIEFDAVYPGDWMLHCHLPHHMMNHMVSMVGPMSQWNHGPRTKGMMEGMGMARGHALSEHNAPGFGRGTGPASSTRQGTPLAGPSPHAPHHGGGAGRTPGFPQDMWMPMDAEVAKPETYGLPAEWSAALGGMSTLVRVLPPDRYEEIMARIKDAGGAPRPAPPGGPAPAGGHRH
ncbi:MAG TPA: copper oxidase [Longimicrobiales bacterium]|nr:copper oxidase [Longimicrobiales bacterium]